MSIEAMKQALHVMKSVRVQVTSRERINKPYGEEWYDEAITSLRQAIADAEKQEPRSHAGVTIWGGDATVTRRFTRIQIEQARSPRALVEFAIQECLNELAITSLSQAIADAEKQEPVAAQCKFDTEKTWGHCSVEHHNLVQSEPHKWPQYQTRLLYTHPQPAQPKREWVGLTDEDVRLASKTVAKDGIGKEGCVDRFAYVIEAKLKEKNT